jgi:hypothetical protein
VIFNWFRQKQPTTNLNEQPFVMGAIEGSRAHRAAIILDRIDRSDPTAFQNMAWTLGDISRFYLNRLQSEGTVIGLCNDLPSNELQALADETENVANRQLQKAHGSGNAKWNDNVAGFALLAALFDIHSRDEKSDAEIRIAARIRSMAIAGRGSAMKAKT